MTSNNIPHQNSFWEKESLQLSNSANSSIICSVRNADGLSRVDNLFPSDPSAKF